MTKTKTYAQLIKQIENLTLEAERVKRKEVDGVIARIREAIDAYGLTARDLGLSSSRGPRPAAKAGKAKTASRRKSRAARFRDEAGNTWGGRGPRPRWLRDALANGKKLEDFAI